MKAREDALMSTKDYMALLVFLLQIPLDLREWIHQVTNRTEDCRRTLELKNRLFMPHG